MVEEPADVMSTVVQSDVYDGAFAQRHFPDHNAILVTGVMMVPALMAISMYGPVVNSADPMRCPLVFVCCKIHSPILPLPS